ncbi:hypothetical protein R6Q59_014849 [Mikania micrantha]
MTLHLYFVLYPFDEISLWFLCCHVHEILTIAFSSPQNHLHFLLVTENPRIGNQVHTEEINHLHFLLVTQNPRIADQFHTEKMEEAVILTLTCSYSCANPKTSDLRLKSEGHDLFLENREGSYNSKSTMPLSLNLLNYQMLRRHQSFHRRHKTDGAFNIAHQSTAKRLIFSDIGAGESEEAKYPTTIDKKVTLLKI